MPREGTKAAEIMRLYNHGIFTIQEIAESVGCHDSYVRVVARQRKGSSMSEIDRRYRDRIYGQGNRESARRIKNEAYRRARADGKSIRQANAIGFQAYNHEMMRSGAANA